MKNNKGQLSIFLAICVVFFMTTLAFVINVGLFIKAKINLQNAVDAAAWSGAAVQARQLTDIAYLNWEMRNVYKEWMFKYYVLGNMSVQGVRNPEARNRYVANNEQMDFTLDSPGTAPSSAQDKYNLPSVCIQLGSENSYCQIFFVPGLPRLVNATDFGADITQYTEEIIDALAETKASSCANISRLNMIVTKSWAYGFGDDPGRALNSKIPNIALERIGAFPKAMELSVRIRNLEAMVNESAKQEVCIEGCANPIGSLESQQRSANERTVKAFYSAYRNLGSSKESELKTSLKLTEISPRPIQSGPQADFDLSYTLIPQGRNQKYYLDLQMIPLNLATFYSLLAPLNVSDSSSTVASDAACQMSKVAVPVPGYPFGFQKNPKFLTYYAVKGEVEFNGLFNPFKTPIKITAYSMAKPFGGRIGPHLFSVSQDGSYVTARAETETYRSFGQVFGIKPGPILDREKAASVIPSGQDFWVQDTSEPIGGLQASSSMKYVHPNLQYNPTTNSTLYGQQIYVLPTPLPNQSSSPYPVGLYEKNQFSEFRNNLDFSSGIITERTVQDAIKKVRFPTLYESKNYLIPSSKNTNEKLRLDSFGIDSEFIAGGINIYAPLVGINSLYSSENELTEQIQRYISTQKDSIKSYQAIMEQTAQTIANMPSSRGENTDLLAKAANIISDLPLTCQSISGNFSYFYLGQESGVSDPTSCPDPFNIEIENYFTGNKINPTYYIDLGFNNQDPSSAFTINDEELPADQLQNFFTAFRPGVRSGSTDQSFALNPFNPGLEQGVRSLRNFYSTKFISFTSMSSEIYQSLIYSEGRGQAISSSATSPSSTPIENPPQGLPANIFQ
jgi:hypothetical protein